MCYMYFQARLLEEMDEEFGVGDLVAETFKEEKGKVCVGYERRMGAYGYLLLSVV